MKYIEVTITLKQLDPFRDLVVDSLGNEGPYDSFVETPDGVKAYVQESLFDEDWLRERLAAVGDTAGCRYAFEAMPDINWNEEWEKQHAPVLVEAGDGKKIWVRAPFHEHRPDADYEIEIEPKMSFGTAHHPTTYMMLSYVAEIDMEGRHVLDMGCGTAVLAILAKVRGAATVEAVDVDEWAFNNAVENAQRNGVLLDIRLGDAATLGTRRYDVVLANINRNILLADMATYAAAMNPGGTLLLSGFYESDVDALRQHAETLGLRLDHRKTRQDWAALRLTKVG